MRKKSECEWREKRTSFCHIEDISLPFFSSFHLGFETSEWVNSFLCKYCIAQRERGWNSTNDRVEISYHKESEKVSNFPHRKEPKLLFKQKKKQAREGKIVILVFFDDIQRERKWEV